ncbi:MULTISPECIES: GNAT family N-acetyltransferase [unclassified Rhizobium]|uniref:GNAT family N-acetyltransferase n=1 Tax=unclassified Rhizobium TaxID=2613769 RepID=UPI000EA8B502|nr:MULTISPECIES: GNAT family N-acetyltransferase [unclassified Rhizobium]AYG70078.1 N-acetyltransferase [Rhizobium sp. CCGE531]AYG76453.1 N-acetyltransferase [Rhizobium sp. CCGE532]
MDSQVRNNSEQHRFERQIHNGMWAAAYYEIKNENFVFFHVEVPEFEGQGIGAALVQGVFDILREQGRRAIIRCSFMENFLLAHPEYRDVVAVTS